MHYISSIDDLVEEKIFWYTIILLSIAAVYFNKMIVLIVLYKL